MTAKNPRKPPGPLTAESTDFVTYDEPLWRIHRLTGRYRQKWNDMRTVGPLDDLRWDPHPEPADAERPRAVSYTAPDVLTSFGEVFHDRRRIVLSRHQGLVSWRPRRSLRLLNLMPPATAATVSWSLRNGASASLDSAVRPTCRAWSRAIADAWPDLDGLFVRSTVTGLPIVVLFAPAADAFPPGPTYSRSLDDPAVAAVAVGVAVDLRWRPPVWR